MRFLWSLAFGMTLVGCGGPKSDYGRVNLVKAHGTVTLDGVPLASAVITFDDIADDTFSYALTDSHGNYTLQFDSEMKGVKPGSKVVRISTTRKILGLNTKPGLEGGSDSSKVNVEKVPQRYNKKSELRVEISPQGKREFDFELLSR